MKEFSLVRTPMTKVIVSPLPASLSKDQFLDWIAPLPQYDFFSYHQPCSNISGLKYAYACINFKNINDVIVFVETLSKKTFTGDNERVRTQCKLAFNQVMPKIEYKGEKEQNVADDDDSNNQPQDKPDIESDPNYISFLEFLKNENQGNNVVQNNDSSTDAVPSNTADTPLVQFLKSHKDNEQQASQTTATSSPNVAAGAANVADTPTTVSIQKRSRQANVSEKQSQKQSQDSSSAKILSARRDARKADIPTTSIPVKEKRVYVDPKDDVGGPVDPPRVVGSRGSVEKRKPRWGQPYQHVHRGSLANANSSRNEKTGMIEEHLKDLLGIQKQYSQHGRSQPDHHEHDVDSGANRSGVWFPRRRGTMPPRRGHPSTRGSPFRRPRPKPSRGYWGPTDDWD